MTSVIVSMFGPDVVRSRLDAVSHHSTEKYVKRRSEERRVGKECLE